MKVHTDTTDFLIEEADEWREEYWKISGQCGTRFIKDGKEFTLNVRDLCSQARKAGIDC